jgi:hypothetical protein
MEVHTARNKSSWVSRSLVIVLALVAVFCISLPVQAEVLTFTTAEKNGEMGWTGGGAIALKEPLTLKVKNTLTSDHGFSIDTMKVKEVIKPGEEKTITVPLANIDKSVSEHRVYCHLGHKKHFFATIKVAGK